MITAAGGEEGSCEERYLLSGTSSSRSSSTSFSLSSTAHGALPRFVSLRNRLDFESDELQSSRSVSWLFNESDNCGTRNSLSWIFCASQVVPDFVWIEENVVLLLPL